MGKGELEVVRPAGVTGEKQRMQVTALQLLLQRRQRLYRQFVAFCQRGNETVAAVRAEPESVAGEEIFVVNEIDHMPPCMAGDEKALNFDAVNLESLAVMQQHLFVVNCDLRQFIEMVYDFSPYLAGEIPVFNLADIELCAPEQTGAVCLHRAHVVGVLMSDEDVPDGLRVDAQPAHFFCQPVVVVPGIDHDGGVALAVEEDVRHPLPHAGHALIHPAGVQRLEDFLAAVHLAHFSFLKFGRFL